MSSAQPLPIETEKARNTRTLILDTALKIACREGLDRLTIGELAKAVGMSKSGLFAHFQGKDNLQLSVLQLARDRFVDLVLRPAFRSPRGEPRLRALITTWTTHLNDSHEQPGGSILIAASIELDDRPGELREFLKKAQKDLISNLEKAAKMAMDEGHFRKDLDIEQFAWSLYSFVLGYHHSKRMLDDPRAEQHLKRAFEDLLTFAGASAKGKDAKDKAKRNLTIKGKKAKKKPVSKPA